MVIRGKYTQRPLILVLVLFGALLGASNVHAQIGGSANLGGAVTDESGGALPGVTITVTNTAIGRAQTLVTGSDGRYRAVALVPGQY
jgi:hypothetical protein